MIFKNLWTLVWKRTGHLVPAIDDGAQGMLFTKFKYAKDEAKRQTEMYSDHDDLIIVEKIEISK